MPMGSSWAASPFKVANLLRGRNKPTYTPQTDTGDFVVVVNAAKVALTGKKEEQNRYMTFSGYVGGEIYRTVPQMRARNPEFIILHAVQRHAAEKPSCGQDADEAEGIPRRHPYARGPEPHQDLNLIHS